MGNTLNKLKVLSLIILVIVSCLIYYFKPLNLGLDIQGGTRLVLEAETTQKYSSVDDPISGVIAVIRNRIDALGVVEPIIQRKGEKQIIVELPGVKDADHAINVIGETALLEFIEAEWPPSDSKLLENDKFKTLYGENARITKVEDGKDDSTQSQRTIILKDTVLTGSDLKGAWPSVDQYGNPVVDIEFNQKGAQIFASVTEKNVGKPIAIVLDKKVISAPTVREPIPSGKAQISGSFTAAQVKDLVVQLRGGALPVPVKVVETKIIGPTLGKDSLDKSMIAGVIGIILIVVFMIMYYRFPGFLSVIALVVYFFLTIAILCLLRTTLTLPGIAGFILSIGMAVDANVIIFERLKEELQAGKKLRIAIDVSFNRAFSAILDSNITTLIATITLFFLGTGTIRGFAVTLSVGIFVSMFTAIVITKFLLNLSVDWNILVDENSPLLYRGFIK